MCNHKGTFYEKCEDCMGTLQERYEEEPVKSVFSWKEYIEKCKELDLVE